MKKISIILMLLSVGFLANAQLDKGVWLIGGSGSFYTYHNEFIVNSSQDFSGNYTESDLSVSIGYFFVDKLSAGLRPCFNSLKVKAGGITSVESQFAIGPFLPDIIF